MGNLGSCGALIFDGQRTVPIEVVSRSLCYWEAFLVTSGGMGEVRNRGSQ